MSTPRKNRIPILIAFGFLLWGCEALWNLGHQSSLKNEMGELFKAHGILISQPDCSMIGTTRSATCRFKASPEQVEASARLFKGHHCSMDSSLVWTVFWGTTGCGLPETSGVRVKSPENP